MGSILLSDDPKHFAGCCLSLSTILLQDLTNLINKLSRTASVATNPLSDGIRVVSIGSGSGLFESLLLEHWSNSKDPTLQIEGVEVTSTTSKPVNVYLPEEAITTVCGTTDISPRASLADVLLFVYPRNPRLVIYHINALARTSPGTGEALSPLRMIIWLGPKADWEDFEPALEQECNHALHRHEVVETSGIVDYEMLAVMHF